MRIAPESWTKIGLAAAFVAVLAAPEILHAAIAVPQGAPAPASGSGKTFVPTCSAGQVVDTRPDPAWVKASFGHDNCWAPEMPAPVDGFSASREQIVAAMAAAKRYDAAAGAYQKCIGNFLKLAQAKPGKSNAPTAVALMAIENHRIATSLNNMKKLAALTSNAINAFNEYGSQCDE